MGKPRMMGEYQAFDREHIESICLYIATKLGDFVDDVVIIGGLVPSLLVDQHEVSPGFETHAGTMDLDVGLSLAILDDKRYEGIRSRLEESGFEPDINTKGNASLQRWSTSFDPPTKIDFLIPTLGEGDQGGELRHIEQGFAAWMIEGLHLAFKDRRRIKLSGRTPSDETVARDVWVCGPGAFTVLKALAFRNRGANKDAYDLMYVWRYVGVEEVARCVQPLIDDDYVDRALTIIREDFTMIDGIGARRAAEFQFDQPDDETQADVAGMAFTLLKLLETD